MNADINLINKKTSYDSKSEKAKKLKNISYILLISVAFLSLVSFLIDYSFSAGYVIKQENKLIESMSSYKELGTQVFLLNDRLSHLNQLIAGRKSFNSKTKEIFKEKPESIIINKYDIGDGGAAMDLTSSSVSDINDFINQLLAKTDSKVLSSVMLDSFSADSSGYSARIMAN